MEVLRVGAEEGLVEVETDKPWEVVGNDWVDLPAVLKAVGAVLGFVVVDSANFLIGRTELAKERLDGVGEIALRGVVAAFAGDKRWLSGITDDPSVVVQASASISVTIGDKEADELSRDRVDGTLRDGLRTPGFTERDSTEGLDLRVDPFRAGAEVDPWAVVGITASCGVGTGGLRDGAFQSRDVGFGVT